MILNVEEIKSRRVVKAVRNVRRGFESDEAGRGMYRPEIYLDLARSRLLTASYRETEADSMVLRRAKAFSRIMNELDIYIQPWEKIVGNVASTPEGLYFGIDQNWRSVKRLVTGEEGRSLLDDEGRAELADMIAYWKGRSMSDRQQNLFTGDILKYWRYEGTFLWSHWTEGGIPNYEKLFRLGLRGIMEEAREQLRALDRTVPADYIDRKEFLEAVVISMAAVITYAGRYAALAGELSARAETPEEKARLDEIARTCARVPEHPPRTLREALQSFFFIHAARYLEFTTVGIAARFDQLFGPYYDRDSAEGRINRDEALELLQLLWVKIQEMGLIYSPTLSGLYGGVAALQAITVGGVDEAGRDVTNDMTYLVLEAARNMRSVEPSIAMRYHDGTPDELLDKAAEVIRTGLGYPSFLNDKAIIPLLEKWNVPLEEARAYAVAGCVYLDVPGKNVGRRAMGYMMLPKCLWWALHQGVNPDTGERYGAPTPDPQSFSSAEEVLEAYLEQVRFFTERLSKLENTSRTLYQNYLPRPFLSGLLDGCIERGRDSRAWAYPTPMHDFIILIGSNNVADSITAIKKVIFEEGRAAMADLVEALDRNWEGYEDLRRMMIRAPKYGNDDDYADEVAARVHHRTSDALAEFTDRFGHPCRGDGSAVSATYGLSSYTPATPDGRGFGDPACDATLSPCQGRDKKGPTAVLKSAAKIDTLRTYNHLLNQKFPPSALEGDMRPVFISYLRAWGDLGLSQIQFNVVERETLIDAQARPDQYPDLIVRVAGYSAYFSDLSKGLQDSIIARTEQSWG